MSDNRLLQKMLQQIGVVLDEAALTNMLWFRDELLRWNKKINLTAITDATTTLEKHLVDSMTLLPCMARSGRVLDMGSGGGFPSIPLKIARPELEIWSVDAVAKKIAFQKHVARTLKLQGFYPLHARLESLADDSSVPAFDTVVTRAFAALPEILQLAGPLLAPGGEVVAMKGADALTELEQCAVELAASGFRLRSTETLRLPQSGAERCLLFFVRFEDGQGSAGK